MISPNEPAAAPQPRPRPRATKPKGFPENLEKPALALCPPDGHIELIQDKRGYVAALMVVRPLEPAKTMCVLSLVNSLGQRWDRSAGLEQRWGLCQVWASHDWLDESLKANSPRPIGTKLAFV